MTALHPEDLIDHEAAGTLSEAQRRLLDDHCAVCPACELQRVSGPAPRPSSADSVLIERVARAASTHYAADARFRRWRRPLLAAMFAGVLGLGGGAAATVIWLRPQPAPAVVIPAPVAPLATPVLPSPPPSPPPEAEAPSGPSAAALFARANEARRMGAVPEAVRRYRDLQRQHPRAEEALLSHVILGRVLLDRMADPWGALASFERYLRSGARGSLREEALVGRALALGRLSDAGAERRAWEALLAAYPDSMYSERARARLADLGVAR